MNVCIRSQLISNLADYQGEYSAFFIYIYVFFFFCSFGDRINTFKMFYFRSDAALSPVVSTL